VSTTHLTRRTFLKLTAAAGAVSLTGCVPMNNFGGTMVYIRSGRGISGISNAARKHNSNRIYLTEAAALGDLPHPGDKSVVKTIVIPNSLFAKLFDNGNEIADLRRVL
jgi:hypothetical protein